jgi:hypothetical protein
MFSTIDNIDSCRYTAALGLYRSYVIIEHDLVISLGTLTRHFSTPVSDYVSKVACGDCLDSTEVTRKWQHLYLMCVNKFLGMEINK